LSPTSCAAAEAAVLAATGGTQGVVAAAFGWEADAVAVRVAIEALELADDAAGAALQGLGTQLALATSAHLAPTVLLHPGVLSAHPGLTQSVVNALGGRLSAEAADALYGDPGRPVVTPYVHQLPASRPTSVRDLVEHLGSVSALSPDRGSAANGTIEVQTITGADGRVRHIVYLPGTDVFNVPWDQGSHVRDLESGLDQMTRAPDTYQQGVLQALHQAGVRRDEPVLVVGHSLGGMVAAAMLADGGGYHITDAITAGSPTAQVHDLPPGAHLLSLEQRGDIVPELDGAPNPDTVEQTTVLFDADPVPGVIEHHGINLYEQGAGLVDHSSDPSISETVRSLHQHGFLSGDGQVRSQLFQITRAP
ncbi:MAG TPA: hypothetical protein PL137_25850, partial [Nocardioides sp.]|nr:hypothetical protein [Nocardioides sp.]